MSPNQHGISDSRLAGCAYVQFLFADCVLDPELYRMQAGITMAHLFAGRVETASAWAEQAYRNLPSFLMVVALIAATRALAGRQEEARRTMDELRKLDPTLRVSKLKDWLPIHKPEHLFIFADGLRKAGLPE